MLVALFNLGGGEIVLILAVVLLLFGAKKLPELAKGLGQGIKEFKKASNEVRDEIERAGDADVPPPPAYPPRKQLSEGEEKTMPYESADKGHPASPPPSHPS